MKTSIILTTYDRPRQLYAVLRSIQRQNLTGLDLEILVINDGPRDESEIVSRESDAVTGLNVRYFYTGFRNGHTWRNMGFAANIGIQQAKGEIVVLSNSDVYHTGNVVRPVIVACERDPMAISTIHKAYDDDGSLIGHLFNFPYETKVRDEIVQRIRRSLGPRGFYQMNPDMPFFMAVRREHLVKLGGYDEDFIGVASEDCDLLDRLKQLGCRYVYAPEGVDVIHLFHGRKTIAQLKKDPGFAYNIRLRQERQGALVRNRGRIWGELIDENAPTEDAPVHLVLWVTSKCTLDCPRCNQRATRLDFVDYEMPKEELGYIIQSCRERKLHFSTIEITGGEPSLWPRFEEGLEMLKDSGLADRVTFITNGNDALRVAETANRLGILYTVSVRQATESQIETHRRTGVGVTWNDVIHRVVPEEPLPDSLPATCSQRHDKDGRVVRQLLYLCGQVYYCCMAYPCSTVTGPDPRKLVPFQYDFDRFFADKKFDLPACSACLCNKKVWDQVPT